MNRPVIPLSIFFRIEKMYYVMVSLPKALMNVEI